MNTYGKPSVNRYGSPAAKTRWQNFYDYPIWEISEASGITKRAVQIHVKHHGAPKTVIEFCEWLKERSKRNVEAIKIGKLKYYGLDRFRTKEETLSLQREYYKRPDIAKKTRDRLREYERRKRLTDMKFVLRNRLKARIHKALKTAGVQKTIGTNTLLGCTKEFFKQWIESKFLPGMSWHNRGSWHIDHIIPVTAGDLADESWQRRVCHYTNLRPLWAEENIRKGNSMPTTQPELLLNAN